MAPSRGPYSIRSLYRARSSISIPIRSIHATSSAHSGHNRWSKIKHDKAKTDAVKNKQRSVFAQEIATASKLNGPDPNMNPRLFDLITKAKREGFAKASIEAAIARGQGRSTSGKSLEGVTIEGMLPNNLALIVSTETDNKNRTLQDVRSIMKDYGGTISPISYLFEKRGRIVFEKKGELASVDVLDAALDAGATDVDDLPDGSIVVFTEPEQTTQVGDVLSKALDLEVATSSIVWDPNADTLVELPDDKTAESVCSFVDELQENDSNARVAMNLSQGSVDSELWKEVQARAGP